MPEPTTARYFDGKSSRPLEVWVHLDPARRLVLLLDDNGDPLPGLSIPFEGCRLRPPLGRVETCMHLPNGAHLTFAQPDAYAGLRKAIYGSRIEEWADRLERYWRGVAAAVVITILIGVGSVFWGIPWLAHKAAFALPESATRAISSETIRIMERTFLRPSEIDPSRQEALQNQFAALLRGGGLVEERFELRFRSAPSMGANAFALPSGVIYMLDDLVKLAANDEEIIAVLAHEVGHVVERHGVQSVLRSTGVFLLISVLLGDVASTTSIATALPAILVESSYSRAFEFDADRFAAVLLRETGRSPDALGQILIRLTGENEHSDGSAHQLSELFATHPETAQRVKAIQAVSQDPLAIND